MATLRPGSALENAAVPSGGLHQCAHRAWQATWQRFFSPQTCLFYDYLSSYAPGRELAHLPSADEVRRLEPNDCGYGTGMEDCAISAGVMLAMLVDRFAVTGEVFLRDRAAEAFRGVNLCATAHQVPGFIARGVCHEDLRSIYPCTSRDQCTHAVHGLWHYARSPLCDSRQRAEAGAIVAAICDRMTRNVTPANDYDSLRADGSRDARGINRMWNVKGHEAARLPMLYMAGWDLTGRQDYHDLALRYLPSAIQQSALVEAGTPTYALLQMQVSLELLHTLTPGAADRRKMREIMQRVSRACAVRAAAAWRRGASLDLSLLCSDWRTGEALRPGGRYRETWYCIRESGEAALAQLIPSRSELSRQKQLLAGSMKRLDYDRVSSSGILYLLAAYWKARRRGWFA